MNPLETLKPLPTKTLGQRVRELRQKADLSLRDLGQRLKDPTTGTPVSAAFLSDIENGRRFPSDDMTEQLAAVLSGDAGNFRECDPRGPAKEIQELATMNAQYAFAFRRAVEVIHAQGLSPQEFVARMESGRADRLGDWAEDGPGSRACRPTCACLSVQCSEAQIFSLRLPWESGR